MHPAIRCLSVSFVLSVIALVAGWSSASAQSGIATRGSMVGDSRWNADPFVETAAAGRHSLALRSDGSIAGWGNNYSGECTAPALPAGLDYVAIAGGFDHSLGLRSDGSVVGFGLDDFGQCDVPALPAGLAYVGIAAGQSHSLAMRSEAQIQLGIKAKAGNDIIVQSHLGMIPTGIFRQHAIAVLYNSPAHALQK